MNNWHDNRLQYARLLAEIAATHAHLDLDALAAEMDLRRDDVAELFDRAQAEWDDRKQRTGPAGCPPSPATHDGLHDHLSRAHHLLERTLTGASYDRLVEMHEYEHSEFADQLGHTHREDTHDCPRCPDRDPDYRHLDTETQDTLWYEHHRDLTAGPPELDTLVDTLQTCDYDTVDEIVRRLADVRLAKAWEELRRDVAAAVADADLNAVTITYEPADVMWDDPAGGKLLGLELSPIVDTDPPLPDGHPARQDLHEISTDAAVRGLLPPHTHSDPLTVRHAADAGSDHDTEPPQTT